MRSFLRSPGALVLASITLLSLAAACSKSPEERVADVRSRYRATLNGFVVREEPIVLAEDAEIGEGMVGETAAEESADLAEVAMTEESFEPVPVIQTVMLDIIVQHNSHDTVPGLTVDISMADGSGVEKGHWRVWLDTSSVVQATPTQFTHILEGVGYEEGDGFAAEVRHPVPVAERGDYKEFSTPG